MGTISETECINQELKISLSARSIKRDHPIAGIDDEEGNKKVKVDNMPFELQVIEYLNKFERPIGSKTRNLRCPFKSFETILKSLQEKTESSSKSQGRYRIQTFN
eukprot:GHVR01051491.1.p1 GENE.GHVR01051491.1~~GHVR01051491.1.p1  ORF type:complete len:105 (-),score=8.97 GHVR01051491.1:583-897(-)